MNQQKLPNSTAVLVLGILSLVGCMCYGLPGMIMGLVGLILANKDEKLYRQNPSLYSDYGNLKAGKILSIIGLILGVLFVAMMVFYVAYFGWETITDPELMQEKIREMQNQ